MYLFGVQFIYLYQLLLLGIRVKIKGEARTSWPVYLNNPQHRYTGHEEYMLIRHYFAGGYSGKYAT